MLQKTNIDGFYKDMNTGAIINKKDSDLLTYRQQVAYHNEMTKVQKEVVNIANELSELKSLMFKILDKKEKHN